MNSDRNWMNHWGVSDRRKAEYIAGVNEFLDFDFSGKENGTVLRCPCLRCNNQNFHVRQKIREHLLLYGIVRSYSPWVHHGENDEYEDYSSDEGYEGEVSGSEDDLMMGDDMAPLVFDATNVANLSVPTNNDELPKEFDELMKDVEAELYPGCKTFKRLEFLVTLLHIKVSNKWSDKSFSMLLKALHRAFNYDKRFPENCYQAKRYTRALGLDYIKIDACINHCSLFWKENAGLHECPKCHAPRWKEKVVQGDSQTESEGFQKVTRVPQLVLRHFPLIPRLQRVFMSSKLAHHMRWHKEGRPDDGIMRHPADSKAWKSLDELYPDFAKDPRNVRLALCTDGFNPGAQLSSRYSIWPVILVPYNLPPWMCMKSVSFMLSLLIPDPKAPGDDIDVFLQPIIDEMKQLWEVGVKTYDAYSGETFDMRGVLLWTVQDFPAYANLSGWSTKGTLACPSCHKDTCSSRLTHGKKWCYMGHRRFLEPDHQWRRNRSSFNKKKEMGPPPIPLSGHDILEELSGFENIKFGKHESAKRRRGERYLVYQWKKRSIFFELPYWRHLLVRHNLDVMHVEKNICENILGTLLDIAGKNKDSLNARLDLTLMNMHDDLQPKMAGDKYQIPPAPYNLSLGERRQVATLLSNLIMPDGYSSNITQCVTLVDGKISGMKSHDCHVFMQDLLTPAFHGVLDEKVLEPLRELSLFFKQLCSKTLKVEVLEQMEKNIAITLCKLERIFIPSFFDVMVHLPIHLATEAKLAGPVHYRWMYRFERAMRTFKSYVRNKARPEGSIAEAYIKNECLTFCSRYLSMTETQFNRVERNEYVESYPPHYLPVFSRTGKPLGKANLKQLNLDDQKKAQLYVLRNCREAQPFFDEYNNAMNSHRIDFCKWFEDKITKLWSKGDERISEELLCLARGPMQTAVSYEGYVVNGFRFHTKRRQRRRKTQNSGVVVKGDVESGEKDFYGVLEEVILLEYDALKNRTSPKVVLFRCKWFDVYNIGRGIKMDKFGSIFLNITRKLQSNEPFALACQIEQVFYVAVHNEPQWRLVIKTNPRNYFDFPNAEDNEDNESFWQNEEIGALHVTTVEEGSDDVIPLVRDDVGPTLIDVNDTRIYKEQDAYEMDDDDDYDDDEVEEEEEEELSNRESSIGSLDSDLEETDSESDNTNE